MTLLDILKDLTYGELADLHIGGLIPGESDNEPDPHQYEQIIGYINMGLNELYKRFLLKTREIYVEQRAEVALYKLHSDYSFVNTASAIPEADRYIIDSVDAPFLDDILKIEEIYDEEGNKLPMNDYTEDLSVFTPSFNVIQVPYPQDNVTIAVQYRATHPKVVADVNSEADQIEIELPNSLRDALLYFVGSRAHRATHTEKSADYWQMYKKACDDVDMYGLEVQGEPGDWRFDDKGWI